MRSQQLKDAATSTGNMAFVRSLSWQSGRKSLELIKKASTVKQCEIIQQPSAPKYHKYGRTFETDGTWVAEEELIQWSLASLRAPLPPDAFKRYFDLFQQVLGVNIQEIVQI